MRKRLAATFRSFPNALRRAAPWALILVGVGVSLSLGYWGFAVYHAGEQGSYGSLDILYLAWQLFTLESGALIPPVPWQLEVARILAPVTAAFAIVRLVVELIRERVRLLRLWRMRDHVVIAGLGRRGLELADGALKCGERVVGIDEALSDAERADLLARGAIVIEADATRLQTLRKVRADRAAVLVSVCGSDGKDLEVALNARNLHQKRLPPQPQTKCYVQISDVALLSAFREHPLLADQNDQFDVVQFNTYENAARLALIHHPLDFEPITPDDPRRTHLILLGFGQMGESLAIQAAKIAHYANGKALKITVIGRCAFELGRRFEARYPQIQEVCELTFEEKEYEDVETQARILELARPNEYLTTIAYCFDDDVTNIQFALELREVLSDPHYQVLVRTTEDRGLARLLNVHRDHRVYRFGVLSEANSWEALTNQTLDRIARAIHAEYVAEQRAAGKPDSPSTRRWHELTPSLRDSNRQQADHIPVKLRALGYHDVRTIEDAANLDIVMSEEQVETLARMEHARWNAERFLAGWTYGPKDTDRKVSPYLVPYDELPEEVKQYDRNTAKSLPDLCRLFTRI